MPAILPTSPTVGQIHPPTGVGLLVFTAEGYWARIGDADAEAIPTDPHITLSGPYASDVAAAVGNVPIGAAYRRPTGEVVWRTDIPHPTDHLEPETLSYLGVAGINFAYVEQLDLFIKGLKTEGAWADLSMWILDTRYQGAGATVTGTGGIPINGFKEHGLGVITESTEEYYFSRGTAKVWTPGALIPSDTPMSLMTVGRYPQQGTNIGPMFGGPKDFASFNFATGWNVIGVSDSTSKNVVYFNNATTGGSSLISARKSFFTTVTGADSGNCSVDGGLPVAAISSSHDYSELDFDAPSSSIFGPGDYAPQSAAPAAASLVAFWRSDQSAKAQAIYNRYKATIGSHLALT